MRLNSMDPFPVLTTTAYSRDRSSLPRGTPQVNLRVVPVATAIRLLGMEGGPYMYVCIQNMIQIDVHNAGQNYITRSNIIS